MRWCARRIPSPVALLAAVLVGFGVVLVCAIASGELLRLAERPDGSTSLDSSITSWVVAHRAHGLTTLARLLSTLGSQAVLLPVTAVVVVALLVRREPVPAGLLVVAWAGAIGLYSLSKHFVHRHRPPVDIWLTGAAGSSYPSGHATQSLSTFLVLAFIGAVWLPRAARLGKALGFVLAASVGWSRIYLGVHWTTDVGAGLVIAVAWITFALWLAEVARSACSDSAPFAHKLRRQGNGEEEPWR